MDPTYRHTQIGWLMIGVLLAGFALVAATSSGGPIAIPLGAAAILGACLILFAALTVTGDERGLAVRSGCGVLFKRFAWSEIATCAQVRNLPRMGWGIRYLGDGWMYNVSGLDAVELRLASGRRYRVGTDDAANLEAFIRARIGK